MQKNIHTNIHTNIHDRVGGFTLIEGLFLLFIFSVTSLAFYQTFIFGTQAIIDAKQRLIATNFTNEELEILRNTPYNDLFINFEETLPSDVVKNGVATTGGIDFTRDVTINNTALRVFTEIYYIDDEEDGTGGAGDDDAPQDYKKVVITAMWGADTGTDFADLATAPKKVNLSSHFIPPHGLETAIFGGVLSVNVFDSSGTAISGAEVKVYDRDDGGALEGTSTTDTGGNVLFPGIESGGDRYRIEVRASGYETIKTLDTTASLNPLFSHQTIIDGTITTANIFTEEVQDFTLYTKSPYCDVLGDISFDLYGGRVIGTDPSNGDADVFVYYGTGLVTDASAEYVVQTDTDADGSVGGSDKASAGSYTLTLQESEYKLLYLDPSEAEVPERITIPHDPGTSPTNTDCNVIVADDTFDSIFVSVRDTSTNTAIKGALVTIESISEGFTDFSETDQYGYAYFPLNKSEEEALTNGGTYDVDVTATDFGSYSNTITVDGLEIEDADLIPL